jgi:hypothetical protein
VLITVFPLYFKAFSCVATDEKSFSCTAEWSYIGVAPEISVIMFLRETEILLT